ncbi:MAG: fluoride efflux transporter CrcB [Microbacteriaceae bacterium]
MLQVIVISVAGGLGAAARLVVDGLLRSRVAVAYPIGTTIINITGSLLLGFVVGLAGGGHVDSSWEAILGTGFLGGFTTFSTASFETVRLLADGRYRAAMVNGLGMLVAAVAAAALGLWLGLLVG